MDNERETEKRREITISETYSSLHGSRGYYDRPRCNHKIVTTKEQCEGQILIKGHGRIYPERICFREPNHIDLVVEKKKLQRKLKEMKIID